MIQITTEHNATITFTSAAGQTQLKEFIYHDTPSISSQVSDTELVLLHPQYNLAISFADADKCASFYGDLIDVLEAKNTPADPFGDMGGMPGMGDMGGMFGEMFGEMNKAEQPDVNPEAEPDEVEAPPIETSETTNSPKADT